MALHSKQVAGLESNEGQHDDRHRAPLRHGLHTQAHLLWLQIGTVVEGYFECLPCAMWRTRFDPGRFLPPVRPLPLPIPSHHLQPPTNVACY